MCIRFKCENFQLSSPLREIFNLFDSIPCKRTTINKNIMILQVKQLPIIKIFFIMLQSA